MGHHVIACYRPHAGKDSELLQCVRDHVPTLRKQGLITDRPAQVLRAKDGTLLELFEWTSEDAVERAHHDPVVQALWERFASVCDFVALGTLPEAQEMFPHFEPVLL
jgi:hypothetical protein